MVVFRRIDSPQLCAQWVLVLTKQAISNSWWLISLHVSSIGSLLKDISRLLTFWKSILMCLSSFCIVSKSPKCSLLCLSSELKVKESSSWVEEEVILRDISDFFIVMRWCIVVIGWSSCRKFIGRWRWLWRR